MSNLAEIYVAIGAYYMSMVSQEIIFGNFHAAVGACQQQS